MVDRFMHHIEVVPLSSAEESLVIIALPDGRDWYKANWAFRQLVQDISQRFGNDNELCKILDLAQAYGMLDLKGMPIELACRVSEAMSAVIRATQRSEIQGWRPEDQNGREMYLQALAELADLLREPPQPIN
jgi:hypothetical protein